MTESPIVEVREGCLSGEIRNGVAVYRGIPYAEPPVGELRWRPPRRHAGWSHVRSAGEFGYDPVQGRSPFDLHCVLEIGK